MIEIDKIYNMDCLEGMKMIPDGSVDCVICDLPYGVTACKWDIVIPFSNLWEQWKRLLKHQGSVLLFGSEPFSSKLRMSNMEWYKYDWKWHKTTTTGFQHAKNMPLKDYEDIIVFSAAGMGHKTLLGNNRMTYNPQGIIKVDKIARCNPKSKFGSIVGRRKSHKENFSINYEHYPRMTLEYGKDYPHYHPTQKPLELIRYLVRTYTNEGDVILDNCMGSGTTAVAAIEEKRHFIGFETEEKYCAIANKRINEANNDLPLFR